MSFGTQRPSAADDHDALRRVSMSRSCGTPARRVADVERGSFFRISVSTRSAAPGLETTLRSRTSHVRGVDRPDGALMSSGTRNTPGNRGDRRTGRTHEILYDLIIEAVRQPAVNEKHHSHPSIVALNRTRQVAPSGGVQAADICLIESPFLDHLGVKRLKVGRFTTCDLRLPGPIGKPNYPDGGRDPIANPAAASASCYRVARCALKHRRLSRGCRRHDSIHAHTERVRPLIRGQLLDVRLEPLAQLLLQNLARSDQLSRLNISCPRVRAIDGFQHLEHLTDEDAQGYHRERVEDARAL